MIIGHRKQWQFLKRSAQSNRIPHALLFFGQEKLGKKTLALEFTKFLLKEDVQKRQHPDFIFIEPREGVIQISQIRELINRLSLRPISSPFKTVIIDQAHCMTQEAQNSFLKTLEEPKGNSVLILVTEHPGQLLSTIRSRCEMLEFFPVERKEIENYLKDQKIPDEKIEEILIYSQGCPGIALDFILNPQKMEEDKKIVRNLIKIINSGYYLRFKYAKDLAQQPLALKSVLNIWLRYFRNILLERVNGSGESFQNHNYSLPKLKKIIKLIENTDFLISTTNINPRLTLEILMLEL